MDSGDVKMLKKLLVVLLALTLIATPALATCPTTWNDPNLTCITTNNWLQFVGNWTYWNTSTWSNFNNYDTLAQANARNVSIWNNFGNYATVTNVSSANTSIWNNFQNYETVANASAMNASIWYALGNVSAPVDYTGLFFQNGTRIMTGSLNAGGYNISNVSSPVISTDAATKGYTDTGISSAESIISGWIANNNSATLSTAGSWIQTNNSATLSTAGSWIQSNNSATLATADSHIASNMSGVLHLTGGTMSGQINAGGYNLSNVSAPVSNGDAVNLNYFNTHSTGGSGTVSNTSISTANNVTVFSDATGRNISDSHINYTTVVQSSQIRTKLTSATTFYVATTGTNDSSHGTASGTPWLTLQYAYNYICANYDLGGQDVTIQLADGTYTSGLVIITPWVGGGTMTVQGNTSAMSNVIISATGDCIQNVATLPGSLTVRYMKLISTSVGIENDSVGGVIYANNIEFGNCTTAHLLTQRGQITINGNYTVSGNAVYHWNFQFGGYIAKGGSPTVTITGTPTISYWAYGLGLGMLYAPSITFSGSPATGCQKYSVTENSIIHSSGNYANFPGSVAGSTATGGQVQ